MRQIRHNLRLPEFPGVTRAVISDIVFIVFAIAESRRIGMRYGWVYAALGGLVAFAFAFAFPLFLLMRERHLKGAS